jgi:hypothetical protein
MPRPCRSTAMPCCQGFRLSFPFDIHSAAVFDSHMSCRAHSAPVPCHDHAVLKATSQGNGTARHGHGMCELASAVQRRHVGDLPAFGFLRLPHGVPRRLLSEAYQSVKCKTNSLDISGYHADFHEGHGTVGEWQGRGMACVN